MWYLSFSAWPSSPSIMISRSSHNAMDDRTPSLFMRVGTLFCSVYAPRSLYLFSWCTHWCFHILATENSAAVICKCRCGFHILISSPLDTHSVERLPDHMGVLFLASVGFPCCFPHCLAFLPAVCWAPFSSHLCQHLLSFVFEIAIARYLSFQLHFPDD